MATFRLTIETSGIETYTIHADSPEEVESIVFEGRLIGYRPRFSEVDTLILSIKKEE